MAPTDEDIPAPFQFSLRQLLTVTFAIAFILAFAPHLRNELPYWTYRIVSPLLAVAAGYAIGHVASRVAERPLSRRRVRLAVLVAVVAMTAISAYVIWADWRVNGWWHELTRPLPYPDPLIHRWAEWVDMRNPPPPGHLKIHGEYHTVTDYLDSLRLVMIAATCALAAMLTPHWPRTLLRIGNRVNRSGS
jgi:hypothetical protein